MTPAAALALTGTCPGTPGIRPQAVQGGAKDPGRVKDQPNKRSSIYLGRDGWWHGWVTIGIKDDGSPDRRHRKARTEAAVTRKVRELEHARDSGHVAGAGRPVTVGHWMETWLTTIAPRRIRRSTLETTYEPKVRNRIIPGLGKHRLDQPGVVGREVNPTAPDRAVGAMAR